MPSSLSEVFLFFKYRRGAEEAAPDFVIKCFMHHAAEPSWIPFQSRTF